MEFKVETGDASDLLYFDSWESKKWLTIQYYLCIFLLWLICIIFTLLCCINKGNIGLIASLLTCTIFLPCGILTIRVYLELSLSVFVIREHFKNPEQSIIASSHLQKSESIQPPAESKSVSGTPQSSDEDSEYSDN